jgi:hypothetical protein
MRQVCREQAGRMPIRRVLAEKAESTVARSVGRSFFVCVQVFDVHFDCVAPESNWRLFDEPFAREEEARQATRGGRRFEIPATLRSALEELGYSEPDSG